MRKKKLLAIVLVAVILPITIFVTLNQLNSAGNRVVTFKKSIARDVDTAEKQNALSTAENVNYIEVFNISRFSEWMGKGNDYGLGSPSDYNSSGTYPAYVYADFIDATVINYYDTRFEDLKGKIMYLDFNYNATISAEDKIHAVYVPAAENESRYTAEIRFLSSNGSILNANREFVRCAYDNSSGIHEIQANEIDFEFSNCFFVEMDLTYSEAHAQLAAFVSYAKQTVIVDENFKPLLLCAQTSQAIS